MNKHFVHKITKPLRHPGQGPGIHETYNFIDPTTTSNQNKLFKYWIPGQARDDKRNMPGLLYRQCLNLPGQKSS